MEDIKVDNSKLSDYANRITHYTPVSNPLMNNRSEDWYAKLGKYIFETLDTEKIPLLDFIGGRIKPNGIVKKFKDFARINNREYATLAINFLTGVLDNKALQNMFGNPILHDEFGEGFNGEYDEETDEYGEPDIKESFASYFVTIGDTQLHIGYDHRGTSVEVKVPEKFNYDTNFSNEYARMCFEALKSLVLFYKLKN